MECFKCGVSDKDADLIEAISGKGIVHVCERCFFEEGIPAVKRKGSFVPGSEKSLTVYERLSHMSGTDKKTASKKSELFRLQSSDLKSSADKNSGVQLARWARPRKDLIENFHWVIMRVRRSKKMTQAQFAEAIGEPESSIRTAEEGVIYENNDRLVSKIENYLRIKILKDEFRDALAPLPDVKRLSFDDKTAKTLTIADLRELKKKKEAGISDKKTSEEDIFSEDNSTGEEDEESGLTEGEEEPKKSKWKFW